MFFFSVVPTTTVFRTVDERNDETRWIKNADSTQRVPSNWEVSRNVFNSLITSDRRCVNQCTRHPINNTTPCGTETKRMWFYMRVLTSA